MPGTRSSARQAAKASSSPVSSQEKADYAPGTKRKASSTASPNAKRGKKGEEKVQTTIEDSMAAGNDPKDTADTDMLETPEIEDSKTKEEPSRDQKNSSNGAETDSGSVKNPRADGNHEDISTTEDNKSSAEDKPKASEEPTQNGKGGDKSEQADIGTGSKVSDADNAVEVSSQREKAVPSSILEKGIIYFFFRGRVGINEPNSVTDVARSYIVLRPLPNGAKLGEGPIGDAKNNRLLALPKKVLPKSPQDRFMTFVEKANMSMDEIKETFSASDYATKTAGDRHTPAAAPIGEGVYAITQTGRDTHLAYILTIPSELSDVQKDVGLSERGSFVTSAKNPQSSGPASATLPQSAELPKEIQDGFAGRSWMPLQPEMLNYENVQFLLIGHREEALEKATQPQNGEEKNPQKETPLEEVEKLEEEDKIRVEHLDGDDSVFTDLGLSSQEYPKLQTTW